MRQPPSERPRVMEKMAKCLLFDPRVQWLAEEVWQVNQGLREAVLTLQRRSEEHDKIEQELRARETYFQRRCEDLERCLNEKTRQLEEEIQNRKAAEEMLLQCEERC